jgi:hypothetical protein
MADSHNAGKQRNAAPDDRDEAFYLGEKKTPPAGRPRASLEAGF